MKFKFVKPERDTDPYRNPFLKLSTEAQAKQFARFGAVVPGFIGLTYVLILVLALFGILEVPPLGLLAAIVSLGLAAYLFWRFWVGQGFWTMLVLTIWLGAELVAKLASADPTAPGMDPLISLYVAVGFAALAGLRGAWKLRKFRAAAKRASGAEETSIAGVDAEVPLR